MSVHLDSSERLLEWATRLVSLDLPPYFNMSYVRAMITVIGGVTGRRQLQVVYTNVPMLEPIMHDKRRVILSLPLIATYMNQPIDLPQTKIRYATANLDLLSDADTMLTGREERSKFDALSHYPPFCGWQNTEYAQQQQSQLEQVTDNRGCRSVRPSNRCTNDNRVVEQLIYRALVLVAHWHQHYARDIPYDTHANFRPLEQALLKRTTTTTIADANESSTDEVSSPFYAYYSNR